jgi:hypothetical protein
MRLVAFGAEELDDLEVTLCFLGDGHRIGLATRRCA